MQPAWRATALPICILTAALMLSTSAAAQDCLKCHADKAELAKHQTKKNRPLEPLLVDGERFGKSAHAAKGCVQCHDGYKRHPHLREAETYDCAECHEEAADVFKTSVHGRRQEGRKDVPIKCSTCHGVHDVMKPDDRESRLHPLNAIRTCSSCHGDANANEASVQQLLDLPYTDDIHAQGLLTREMNITASCISCHGGHDIRAKGDPASRTSRLNVQETCAQCHLGVAEGYVGSVHFEKLQADGHNGPACNDCHPPHGKFRARTDVSFDSVQACGRCHRERLGTFRRTYHGKVSTLGEGERVAGCADCHGTHETRAAVDPKSRIHRDNLVQTCSECHEHANPGFVQYLVHADPHDAKKYPGLYALETSMGWLLTGTFLFFGLHSLLWLLRSLVAGERRKRGARLVRRWSPFYLKLHIFFMCSFTLLALTGFPLLFSERPWAGKIMRFFGGTVVAGTIHRLSATVLIVCMLAYVVHIVRRLVKREKGLWTGPNTLLPRWKDAKDVLAHFAWFFGLKGRPRFDRWTYYEKFHFYAVFWGMVVIGGTGLLLWFPQQVTSVLPGWLLNVAVIVHSHEALLAVGFSFTVHMFQAILRPDRFPTNTVFYTGGMTEEAFKQDRPLEYERAVEAGTYEQRTEDRPPASQTRWVRLIGATVMVLGMALTFLAFFVRD